ncbi:MAG: inositol monophosphatase [candidate division Zixibacteria bacterium]|nr:inositol monophosphatase [candidate division Zixibacteria bacterium]
MHGPRDPVWADYLDAALPIALAAGDLLARRLGEQRSVELKGEINLVTEMDRQAEELIVSRLTAAFPGFGIVAEEGAQHRVQSEYVWYVDPLDGTTNYAHGLPIFCVSLGLWRGDNPVCGVVYHPMGQETFTAVSGGGAYLNGRRLAVSSQPDLGSAILATGFPYDIRRTDVDNLDHFARFAKRAQAIRRMGAAALDMAWTAAGRFDGFWEMKLSPWDIAAGALLCLEAGAIVTDFRGEPFTLAKGQAIAANAILHQHMLEIIAPGKFPAA